MTATDHPVTELLKRYAVIARDIETERKERLILLSRTRSVYGEEGAAMILETRDAWVAARAAREVLEVLVGTPSPNGKRIVTVNELIRRVNSYS